MKGALMIYIAKYSGYCGLLASACACACACACPPFVCVNIKFRSEK
jgi:hypothetical protein